jgi:hypothetical protein
MTFFKKIKFVGFSIINTKGKRNGRDKKKKINVTLKLFCLSVNCFITILSRPIKKILPKRDKYDNINYILTKFI